MAPRLPARSSWAAQLHHATTSALSSSTTPASGLVATSLLLVAERRLLQPATVLPRTARRGVKYGWSTAPKRVNHDRFNDLPHLPARTTGPAAALERRKNTTPVRAGVLAVKKGMTAFFSRRGTRIPCTILQLDQVQVVGHKTFEPHGYWAVQVGSGAKRAATATAPMLGEYEAKGLAPKQHLAEFKVRGADGLLPVGVQLQPDWFHVGQYVDVRSNSRGQGFAGGMKRHGFGGQEASHGNSLNHRTIGSTGPSQGGGSRVHPGKKMPGRMGNERVTVQNLPILQIDNELGIVVVKGAVAGPKGALVKIQDAVKKPPPAAEFISKTKDMLQERFPNAAELLEAAQARHQELKLARQAGSIYRLTEEEAAQPAV